MLEDEVFPWCRMLLKTLDTDTVLDGVDDALVGLVRDDQIEITDLQMFALADAVQAGDHASHGFGEHLAALHLNEAAVPEGDGQAAAIFTFGGQFGSDQAGRGAIEMIFTVQHGGGGCVAEQDGRVEVVQVQQWREHFGGDDQDTTVGPALEEVVAGLQRVEVAGAGGVDVEGLQGGIDWPPVSPLSTRQAMDGVTEVGLVVLQMTRSRSSTIRFS